MVRPIPRRFLALLFIGAVTLAGAQPRERDPDPRTEGERSDRGDYLVGIEDELEIVVWKEDQLTRTVKVRPDGKISLPLVNDIGVAGLTPEQIRRAIASKLSPIIRDPNVTVIVGQINSFKVYFLGEVKSQGVQSFYRPTRLLQGIAAAGGPTEFAKKELTLIRDVNGLEKRISIDYKRLLVGDVEHDNIYLQTGDVLVFH